MVIEKIRVNIRGQDYAFSVEILQDQEDLIYRATPDQGELLLERWWPGAIDFIDFNRSGNARPADHPYPETIGDIMDAIGSAIKQQLI
jgi:hypothetical protein